MTSKILSTVEEAKRFAEGVRQAGKRLAFVPTMGFLHEGHLSLMREGKRRAEVLVVSVFVNPTQFGPQEDLARYPRDFEGDLVKCAQAGADAVFAPEPSSMYPAGHQTFVEVSELSKGLCGERRPGHFKGVATIVTKLLCIVRPHLALFGEKDYQQLQVISALSRDLNLGVEIVGMPIVREHDGLAMSSRNTYLSPVERAKALSLSRGLKTAEHLFGNGVADARELVMAVRRELEAAGIREDYVELVDAATLQPVTEASRESPARLMVAAFVGKTRLIDNIGLGE